MFVERSLQVHAGVMQRNNPLLRNNPWVISLRRRMTRVIILHREMTPDPSILHRIMTRVIPLRSEMTHGSFCRGGSFLCLTQATVEVSLYERVFSRVVKMI